MTLHNPLRKRLRHLAAPFLTIAASGILFSCQDDTPSVGSSLASGEVQIALDSLIWNGTEQYITRGDQKTPVMCPKISYTTVFNDTIDSRSATNLIGRISVPEYGDLNCSFVSQMMCTTTLDIPDSIPIENVDSMKLIMSVPRGALTGDSLAPQQLKVYRLTKSLPKDIDNTFDPTGYYDPANPLGSRSFTLSALGMSDSLYFKQQYVGISIPMSKEMAVETVKAYRDDKTRQVFAWPQTFEQYFHGIYVEPSFGRGCVANIAYTKFSIYYSYKTSTTSTDSVGTVTVTEKNNIGAAGVFATSPIVLNSNNITYRPSAYLKGLAAQNEALVTSPGGYRIRFSFPGRELVDIYKSSQSKMAVVSGLKFTIPVEEIENDYDLTPPPYMLMVKTSKLNEFIASNSLPDNKDSFYAVYDSKKRSYAFESMRAYILDLINNGVTEDDLDLTIIPIDLVFESDDSSSSNSNYDSLLGYLYGYGYGYGNSNTTSSEPIRCTPYISNPSMCRLKMDEAQTIFTYSLQQMK